MHGAKLVAAMQRQRPGLRFSGIGGRELAAVGTELLFEADKIAVVGITEVISHFREILAARQAIIRQMRRAEPALLILIDYPDFNLLLAAKAKKFGIPVFYYISPQVWAWRGSRAEKIGRLADRTAVILPFEQAFYAERGVAVDFVGHPLADTVRPELLPSREDFCQAHDLDPGSNIIGVLPGSRIKEIRSLLPDFLAAAQILTAAKQEKKWLFLLPRAAAVPYTLLLQHGLAAAQDRIDIRVLEEDRYALMAACDAALAASGTVTLELALLGIPTVAAYRVSALTYRLGRLLVRDLHHFSLVNLIAGREVIPELLQDQVRPQALADHLQTMLENKVCREHIQRGLAEVAAKLGLPGCAEQAARLALSCIR